MTSKLVLIVAGLMTASNATSNNEYLKNNLSEDFFQKNKTYEQGQNQINLLRSNEYALREEDLHSFFDKTKKEMKHMQIPRDTTKNNKYTNKAKPYLTRMQHK